MLKTALKLLLILPLLLAPSSPGRAQTPAPNALSLDGNWQIVFDRNNEGNRQAWFYEKNFPLEQQRDIPVPSCWELTEKDYEGVAFYRRAFTLPPNWQGKVIRLQFEAANFRAEVWLNDTAVGVHEGGFTPFEFRVDDLLTFDHPNILIVRVVGPILLQDRRIDGLGPMETPQWRGAITGGLWQSVRLVASGPVYVKDVFIEPNIARDTATFHVQLVGASARGARSGVPPEGGTSSGKPEAGSQIEIIVRAPDAPDKVVARLQQPFTWKPGVTEQSFTLQIPDALYWSPDHPQLYRAEVAMRHKGALSDRWTARFGLREFTIRDRRYYLNGQPLYLKATFFEGLYPTQLAYPDSRDMAMREIRLAKEAGFNMIRPWRKPPPRMWLDLADEMGVLTVGSMAIECMDYPIETANLPRWVENEIRESIRRDRNRACLVQWELFNELKRPVLKRLLRPMAVLARQLDPTRLILDESGGWAQGANIYLPYAFEPTKFNDIHDYPGPHINHEVFTKLVLAGQKTHEEMRQMGLHGRLPGRNVVPGLMTFFSELGYGSLPDLVEGNRRFAAEGNPLAPPTVYYRRLAEQHKRALKASGFDAIYPDLQRFCRDQQRIHGTANQRMIEAVRCNPVVAGYCIHALCAGDWIMGAGLLDLWRNPKTYAYEGTRAASQPRILVARVSPRNIYAERGARITITGVNELAPAAGSLRVRVLAEDGGTVFTKDLPARLGTGISPLFEHQLDTTRLQGPYTVRALFIPDFADSVTVENQFEFDVFTPEQLTTPPQRIAVLDPDNALKTFLRGRGIACEDFGDRTPRTRPVFVSRTPAATPARRKQFERLEAFVRAGGTAVYLQGGGPKAPWGRGGPASRLLPFRARLKQAIGLWTCIPHLVQAHPVFDGLPVNGMMGPIYDNVCAETTLLDVSGDIMAGTIAFDWFPDYDLSRRHYYGPGDTWWGADLAAVRVGQGRCIVSQLRLLENLGQDPVADKILFNLIGWVTDHRR